MIFKGKTSFLLNIIWLFSIISCSDNPSPLENKPIIYQSNNEKSIDGFPLAFPGAEGFGQTVTGGRGGEILFVTNLNDSGKGSFRDAIETLGARYILFKVSGTIELESDLEIRYDNVTIAGQTAPGDGICIRNHSMVIAADNVIIRFLRFRLGDTQKQEKDALEGCYNKHLIIDHCSMSWSVDECVSLYNNEYTTLQWCIISEGLKHSAHGKGAHSFGGIWGGRKVSFHHNLIAHHSSRTPRLGETINDSFALNDLVDLRNNVIFNWEYNSSYGGEAMNVNIVNCYYKPGPATVKSKRERIISIYKNSNPKSEIYDRWGKFYIDGNYVEGSGRTTRDNWKYGVFNQIHKRYKSLSSIEAKNMRMTKEHDIERRVTTHTAIEAYEKVLAISGASLKRDAVDERVVKNVEFYSDTKDKKSKSNGIIDSQKEVGGWPILKSQKAPPDSSMDGMPDYWKINHKLNPNHSNPNEKDLSTVYDNIEVYINSLVSEIILRQK